MYVEKELDYHMWKSEGQEYIAILREGGGGIELSRLSVQLPEVIIFKL